MTATSPYLNAPVRRLSEYLSLRQTELCLEANNLECRYDVMPDWGRKRLNDIAAERRLVSDLSEWADKGCPADERRAAE